MAVVLILDLMAVACTQAAVAAMEQTSSATDTAAWEVTMDSIRIMAIRTPTTEVAATWATAITRQMCSPTVTRSLKASQAGTGATIKFLCSESRQCQCRYQIGHRLS